MNLEAEMSLVGSVILNAKCWNRVAHVKDSHFERRAHGVIWESVRTLIRQSRPVDFVTLKGILPLEEIGGIEYVVACAESCPSASNASEYARMVLEDHERRCILSAATRVMTLSKSGASLEEIRAASQSMRSISAGPMPLLHISEVDDSLAEQGVTTGFSHLDNKISTQGYPTGQMTVVSAYHKSGKSTFMLGSALKQSESMDVLYATFADLSARNIRRRLKRQLCGFAKVPGTTDGMVAYDNAVMALDTGGFYLFDATSFEDKPSVEVFCEWVKALRPFGCIFVDYAQEIHTDAKNCWGNNDEQTKCASALVWLASKLNVPVVVGSQITPGKDGGTSITKGSRSWEEKAGWVLRLPETKDAVEIAFSRFGPQKVRLSMRWNDERLAFEEVGF